MGKILCIELSLIKATDVVTPTDLLVSHKSCLIFGCQKDSSGAPAEKGEGWSKEGRKEGRGRKREEE
jgi:hypothetical protein